MHTFIRLQRYARQTIRQAIIKIESERSSSNAAFFYWYLKFRLIQVKMSQYEAHC